VELKEFGSVHLEAARELKRGETVTLNVSRS